jgi:hypothetical protein
MLNNKVNVVSWAVSLYMNRIRKDFLENPEYQKIPVKDYGTKHMTDYSYSLGMVIFALLYDIVGQDQFNNLIGSFYSAYRTEGATLNQFIENCKQNSKADLTGFFNDWILSAEGIKLIMEGKSYDEILSNY